jgi:peptidase A24-like protein
VAETIRSYLRRRYRWALSGSIGGALGALLAGSLSAAPGGAPALALQGACAVVWGGALLVAARSRCPRCHARIAAQLARVIPVMVLFSLGTPAGRCPHCGASLEERYR